MATKRKTAHPVDGLYTFSAKRARELGACDWHLTAWVGRHGNKIAPITLADMAEQTGSAGGGAISWCLRRMRDQGLITSYEFDRAIGRYWDAATPDGEARVLLDALLIRAKREGRA